jgi:hypothetical protein
VGHKKLYLKEDTDSVSLLKLILNGQIPSRIINKNKLRYLKMKYNLPLKIESKTIKIEAHIYLDLWDFELAIKMNDEKKIEKLFKSLPFGKDKFHATLLNDLTLKVKEIINNYKKAQ